MEETLVHEGAGDTTVQAAISVTSLQWDPLGDGGYDLLCHYTKTEDPFVWTYFPNIQEECPEEKHGLGPFSSTWVEDTSQLCRSSYPYTFYQTSFDRDIEEYKSCTSGEEYYSCESDQTDEEEGYYKCFIENHQANVDSDMTVNVKVTVVRDNQKNVLSDKSLKFRKVKYTKSRDHKRSLDSDEQSSKSNKKKKEKTLAVYNKNIPKLEYLKFEPLNVNEKAEDGQQASSPTADYSISSTLYDNELLKRLVDPLQNAVNYQLVAVSSESDTNDVTTEESHFIAYGPKSHDYSVDDGHHWTSLSSLDSEDRLDESEFDLKKFDAMSSKINYMKEWFIRSDDVSSEDEIRQPDDYSDITPDDEKDLYNAIHSYISNTVPIVHDLKTDLVEGCENKSLYPQNKDGGRKETPQKPKDIGIPSERMKRKSSSENNIFSNDLYSVNREEKPKASKESPKAERNIDMSIEHVIENWLDFFIENALIEKLQQTGQKTAEPLEENVSEIKSEVVDQTLDQRPKTRYKFNRVAQEEAIHNNNVEVIKDDLDSFIENTILKAKVYLEGEKTRRRKGFREKDTKTMLKDSGRKEESSIITKSKDIKQRIQQPKPKTGVNLRKSRVPGNKIVGKNTDFKNEKDLQDLETFSKSRRKPGETLCNETMKKSGSQSNDPPNNDKNIQKHYTKYNSEVKTTDQTTVGDNYGVELHIIYSDEKPLVDEQSFREKDTKTILQDCGRKEESAVITESKDTKERIQQIKPKTTNQTAGGEKYGMDEELHIIYSDEKMYTCLPSDHGIEQSLQKKVWFADVRDDKAFENVKERRINDNMHLFGDESYRETIDKTTCDLTRYLKHGPPTNERDKKSTLNKKIEIKNDAQTEIHTSQLRYEDVTHIRGKTSKFSKGFKENSGSKASGRSVSINTSSPKYDENVIGADSSIDRRIQTAENKGEKYNRNQGTLISAKEHDQLKKEHSIKDTKMNEKSKISHIKEAIKQSEKSFEEFKKDVNSLYRRFMNKTAGLSYKKQDIKTNDDQDSLHNNIKGKNENSKVTDATIPALDDINTNKTIDSNVSVSDYVKKYESFIKYREHDEKSNSSSSVSTKVASKTPKSFGMLPANDVGKEETTHTQKDASVNRHEVPNNNSHITKTSFEKQKEHKESYSISKLSSLDKIVMDTEPELADDTSFDNLVNTQENPAVLSGCGDHNIIEDASFDKIVATAEKQKRVSPANNNDGINNWQIVEISKDHANTPPEFKSLKIILDEEEVESSLKSIHKKPNQDDQIHHYKNEEFDTEPEIQKTEYKSERKLKSDIKIPVVYAKVKTDDKGKVDSKSSKDTRNYSDISKTKQSPKSSTQIRGYSSSLDRSVVNASPENPNEIVSQRDSKKYKSPLENSVTSFGKPITRDNPVENLSVVAKRSPNVQNMSPEPEINRNTENKRSKTKIPSFRNLNGDVDTISNRFGSKESQGYLSRFHKKKYMASTQKDEYGNSMNSKTGEKEKGTNSVTKENVKRNSQDNLTTKQQGDVYVKQKSSELDRRDKKAVDKTCDIENEVDLDNLEIDVGALATNLVSRNQDIIPKRHQRKSVEELKLNVDSIARAFTKEQEIIGEKRVRSIQSLKDLNIRIEPIMSAFNTVEDEVKTFAPNSNPKAADFPRIITTPRGCS